MELVVNEWLLEYIRPDANPTERALSIRFMNCLSSRGDKMVVRRPSSFFKKFYKYMKQYGRDADCRPLLKKLRYLFLDSDKTRIIDDSDVGEVPKEVEGKVPFDDRYLVESAFSSHDRTIVTTDSRLKQALQGKANLKIYLVDEFLQLYCAER